MIWVKHVSAMITHGRTESILVNSLTEPEVQPCLTSDEVELAMTWQLLLAAQQADAVIPYFVQQLRGDEAMPAVNPDECSDEFKVLASQFRHLSITEEDESEVPRGLLFFKKARIVAPASIWQKLTHMGPVMWASPRRTTVCRPSFGGLQYLPIKNGWWTDARRD